MYLQYSHVAYRLMDTTKRHGVQSMNTRPFGPDKRLVSEVGLGTWQIGGTWGSVDETTAMEIPYYCNTSRHHIFRHRRCVWWEEVNVHREISFAHTLTTYLLLRNSVGVSDPGWPETLPGRTSSSNRSLSLKRLAWNC
jgi:hypothetical protein